MNRFSRLVLGYHGCTPEFADALIHGEVPISAWEYSANPYDWLGHGIYFWEFAPQRARAWSDQGGVVGAVIQLGTCLDLTDIDNTSLLAREFELVRKSFEQTGMPLPENKGKRRDLDCLLLNKMLATAKNVSGIDY